VDAYGNKIHVILPPFAMKVPEGEMQEKRAGGCV